MVFHEHKCIYFHIGKTAGVSVERWLRDEKRDHRVADHDSLFGWDPEEGIYLQHATAKVIQRKLGSDIFDSYYKFTVVRNPFSRLVSVYYYLYDHHVQRFGNFRNFVLSLPELATAAAHQKGSHYLPQVCYTQLDGVDICDYVAHFERLPYAIRPVASALHINRRFPQFNTYRHPMRDDREIAEYYDETTTEIVRQLFEADFDCYGYSKNAENQLPVR